MRRARSALPSRSSRLARVGGAAAGFAIALGASTVQSAPPPASASPLFGVALPAGYRQWELVSVAQEAAPLDELRAVLANPVAMRAYRAGRLPFPDGSVLVKLAWKRAPSVEFAPASVPGATTTIQVMQKDSARFAASGGWGFARFVAGQPADEAQHQTCVPCHRARVKQHDLVFTRYAP